MPLNYFLVDTTTLGWTTAKTTVSRFYYSRCIQHVFISFTTAPNTLHLAGVIFFLWWSLVGLGIGFYSRTSLQLAELVPKKINKLDMVDSWNCVFVSGTLRARLQKTNRRVSMRHLGFCGWWVSLFAPHQHWCNNQSEDLKGQGIWGNCLRITHDKCTTWREHPVWSQIDCVYAKKCCKRLQPASSYHCCVRYDHVFWTAWTK